jgi:hypothetical protein
LPAWASWRRRSWSSSIPATGPWRWSCSFWGTIGISASYVFYDALLPHVARAEDIDYVSSKGYALGYLGGGILLAVNILIIQVIWAGSSLGPRLSFLTVAFWWAIFTVPLIRPAPYRWRLKPPAVGLHTTSGDGQPQPWPAALELERP